MAQMDAKLKSLIAQIELPDALIHGDGKISNLFLQKNITTFYDAVDWVYRLPYAPPSEPFNFKLVLKEGRGTCSTRHALLVSLAKELGLPIDLGLAIYNLTPQRFPMLKDILQKFNIPYIPESHNFMVYNNQFLDITFHGNCKILSPDDLIQVELIQPENITSYKADVHKKYLSKWHEANDFIFTMEDFDIAHHECIVRLGDFYA